MKKLNIHFVGIKGVGMTPLAIIAKEAGFTVTGSDIEDEFITDIALKKVGIVPIAGFSEKNIKTPDLVIITGAHGGFDNIEAKTAAAKKIKVITQGEAVGLFMNGEIFGKKYIGLSVAGTHGKTTTSAMIATVLTENKMDPSYVIGTGNIPALVGPGHKGGGKYFIAEADEYATEPVYNKKAKLLWQFPKIAIITNIEFDHHDIYNSIDEIRDTYFAFSEQLPQNGTLIACGDDPEIKKIIKESGKNILSYGFSPENIYVLEKVHISGEHMFFSVSTRGMLLGEFMTRVIGEHNALNALSAIIACLEMGLSIEKIKKGLLAFTGSKRRLEYMGELTTGARVYDDYAHHPTEIKTTLNALRSQYPKKRIIAVFQPHTFSRTKKLLDQFAYSFKDADVVLLTQIYASLREQPDPTISSEILAASMNMHHKSVIYLKTINDVVQYINENRFRSDTVLITLGAGDVYKIISGLKFV